MQVIHVLRHHAKALDVRQRSQLDQRQVTGIGRGFGSLLRTPLVPGPDAAWTFLEGLQRRQILGFEVSPQAIALVPEGGDAALGGHACAGQHDDMVRGT